MSVISTELTLRSKMTVKGTSLGVGAVDLPLLSDLRQCLQEDGDNGLVEIGTDGKGLKGVTTGSGLLL